VAFASKATVLGDPNRQPWEDLKKFTPQVEMEEVNFSTYYITSAEAQSCIHAMIDRVDGYGTVIVLFHAVLSLAHGVAHSELHIDLGRAETYFVLIVIGLCPLVAMGFLWTSWRTAGLVLLILSMAGWLLFSVYHHVVVMGPDHIGEQIPGLWATTFAITAYGIHVAEALGSYVGLRLLLRKGLEEEKWRWKSS